MIPVHLAKKTPGGPQAGGWPPLHLPNAQTPPMSRIHRVQAPALRINGEA